MQRLTRAAALAAVASLLASCSGQHASLPTAGPAQHQVSIGNTTYSVIQRGPGPRPMDVVFHYNGPLNMARSSSTLPTWNGSFTYNNQTYNYTMVGTDPSSNNAITTVPVDIIPIKVVIGSTTYDPLSTLPDGNSVVQSATNSPIFKSGVKFKSGGVLMGDGQYLASFQRGNFWEYTKTHKMERVRLGVPNVLAEQTITPTGQNGGQGDPFGIEVGLVNINYIDPILNQLISSLNIPPGTLPIFMTYDVYLTGGQAIVQNCCIGGYHNFNGTNTYMQYTYIYNPNNNVQFSQDVGALSHEVGEWYDDPLINNSVPCGILEVGDPLENDANYGLYPYSLNGETYHLQDLTYLPYFGAPASTSVKGLSTFQGAHLNVCQNGG